MLVVFQDLFYKNQAFQLMDQVEVLSKVIGEPDNLEEIKRFLASYLIPPDFERAMNGMATMAILGYMCAKGEDKVKGMLI
jgi:hypothetical protein